MNKSAKASRIVVGILVRLSSLVGIAIMTPMFIALALVDPIRWAQAMENSGRVMRERMEQGR